MSSDGNSENELEEDYYTFLNLPRDATSDQINNAYRKLSRIYHPDKHTDLEKKKKAELLFNRTKRAYEVLSDPHQRAIYDSVGEKGLRTEGWELVHRTKTPAEIREEYQRLAEAAEERKLLQRTNPRGNVTINVNATEIFTPYDENEMPNIEVSSMSISQSIEAPITRRDTLMLSGNLASTNGNGSGNFVVSGRRLVNKGWMQADIGAGSGPVLAVKGGRSFGTVFTLNGGVSVHFRHNSSAVPALFSTLAVQLDKQTVGSLSLNGSPQQSSMTTQIESSHERYAWTTSFVIGSPHIYFTLAYTRKMLERELKLRVATKVGTFGFLAEYGAEKKVSKYSSVSAAVMIGVPTGVMLRFKVIRSNQTYVFPVHLSEEIVPAAIFYATITPILVWFVVKKTIIEPMTKERKNFEIERTKRQNEERMAAKREEARAAVDLMQHTYERSVNEELSKDGLIITRATYGRNTHNGLDPQNSIDVTIPLQCLVRDSLLLLYNASKSELPGFYDPCIGEDKRLCVEYTFRNENKVVVVKDQEALQLPQTASSS